MSEALTGFDCAGLRRRKRCSVSGDIFCRRKVSVAFYFPVEHNFRWRQTIIRKMPKAFFVIVPAGKGDGARGEEGNAAFASEPFPSSLRKDYTGCMKPIRQQFCV